MQEAIVETFAQEHHIPLPVAKQLAGVVAQRCALLANRYEPEGVFTYDQLSAVETIGAKIGTVIIEAFPPE